MRPPLAPIAATLPDTFPFIAPEAIERASGVKTRARVGANESGFGPSPRVVEAVRAAAPGVWKYCDPENYDIKVALAAHLGAQPGNIAIGEGIDGLQSVAARLYLAPGEMVLTSLGAYPTFNYHAEVCGAGLTAIPYDGNRESLEGLLAAARRDRPRIVYLCNPDNPMGTWWPAADVQRFIEALPEECMLLLDEAYGETAPEGTLPALDVSRPNVIRFRTFSKTYGLAGLRLGYAIGEEQVIRAFDRVRNHFGVNLMAQVAGLVALADQAWLADVIARNAAARDRLHKIAADNGLRSIQSATNFVTVDCGRDGPYAVRVLKALAARGVFVRKPSAPGLDRFVRISTGPEDQMDIVAEELRQSLRDAASAA
jgi:histidinol-phosphate aminotransferase